MSQPPQPPFGPPLGAFPPPPPPAGRGPGPLLFVLIAAVAAVLVLIGVVAGVLLLRDDGPGTVSAGASHGPVDLREPLTFRLVAAETPPPCAPGALRTADGATCYALGPEQLTVRRLEQVKATPPDPATGRTGWSVSIALAPADASGFADLTRKAMEGDAGHRPSGRMAMLVGGAVVSDPAQVTQPILDGRVEINGPPARFTRAYVEGVVHRMTGG